MFGIPGSGHNLTQGLQPARQSADSNDNAAMLTISITFAVLVALWGFSAVLVSHAKRGLRSATTRAARLQPVARTSTSRTRGTRPVPSA